MAETTDTIKEPDTDQRFNVAQYLSEVRVELMKAEWPTRAELIRLTQVVLTLIAIVAAYCGSLDAVLTLITNKLFTHS